MELGDQQQSSIDTKVLAGLFKSSPVRKRDKGQLLIYQGDIVSQLYYINRGYVRVYMITDDGDERTLLILTKNDLFPLLKTPGGSQDLSLYFYETMTETELRAIDQQDLLVKIENDRAASWAMFHYISEFSNSLIERIAQLESKSAEGKVIHLLDYLIKICGKPLGQNIYRLQLKLTQQEIANLVGYTRETASVSVKKLKNRGIISQKNGYVVIDKGRIDKI